jgi:hypothetical protein
VTGAEVAANQSFPLTKTSSGERPAALAATAETDIVAPASKVWDALTDPEPSRSSQHGA